jgi:hypothetical protein
MFWSIQNIPHVWLVPPELARMGYWEVETVERVMVTDRTIELVSWMLSLIEPHSF